jgi:hypothetical protein
LFNPITKGTIQPFLHIVFLTSGKGKGRVMKDNLPQWLKLSPPYDLTLKHSSYYHEQEKGIFFGGGRDKK